jgi:hypothetical protein
MKLLSGLVLLGIAGWIFRAVLTEGRPGRVLLGDWLYAYWPLQPGACVVIGVFVGVCGLLLLWMSPAGRSLLLLPQRGGWLQGLVVARQVEQPAVIRSVPKAVSVAASVAVGSTSGSAHPRDPGPNPGGDHHGI